MSRGVPRTRRRAREAALQILYQWEIGKRDVEDVITTFFTLQWPDATGPTEEVRAFAADLARDTVRQVASIDQLIADASEHWRPERMAIIDRLILRMAVSELQRDTAMPAAIIINEALELARTFSSPDSVKFVNGMLDGIRKKMQRP